MYRIAIDIGGTQLRIALVDEEYRIVEVVKTPNDRTAGLPPVPAIFPPAEPWDPLENGTLGGVVSNGLSRLEFDARGGLKVNGKTAAFVELEMKDGAKPVPERVVLEYGKYLHVRYPDGKGKFHVTVKKKGDGLSFVLGGFKVYGAKEFRVFGIPFDPQKGVNGRSVGFDGRDFFDEESR